MSRYRIKRGIAPIADGNSRWFILDETGPKKIISGLALEVIRLIDSDLGNEDNLAEALANRFPQKRFIMS